MWWQAFSLLLLIWMAEPAAAGILVIVHRDNPVSQLQREQVVDIFMGRRMTFPQGGDVVLPLDQAPDSAVRSTFYRALVGKSVAQVNAYWARLLFTGRATPPRVLPTPAAILKAVRENPDAIGYIESDHVPTDVKAVFSLE
jgi:ABC-type phosphate transport system substrate-binding protein